MSPPEPSLFGCMLIRRLCVTGVLQRHCSDFPWAALIAILLQDHMSLRLLVELLGALGHSWPSRIRELGICQKLPADWHIYTKNFLRRRSLIGF